MKDDENKVALSALDHSYRWFEYHAKQRLEMFKFFILISAGLISVAGFSMQAHQKVLLIGSGVLLIALSLLFWKIDQRGIELTNYGERAITAYWKEIGLDLSLCPAANSQKKIPGHIRFRQAFATSFATAAVVGVAIIAQAVYG